MAETKADLLKQAAKLGLKEITPKSTMAEMREAILAQAPKKHDKEALPVEEHEAVVAKAGKRSAKALAEAEEVAEKQEKKLETAEAEKVEKPKIVQKLARPKLERAGKKLREVSKLVDKTKEYSIKEAVDLAIKTTTTKFDSTVELHIRLNVDPKHADQNIRENIVLPAGTGRSVKVAVFAEADDVTLAKKAGADIAGYEEFLQQLDKGIIDFDVLIATPMVMAKLGKYARILGPKGLMPNPKSGTVTKDVVKAIEQSKAGKVELRVDENGIVHLGIGKVSFGTDKIMENVQAVFSSVKSAKPSSVKANYVETIFMTTSMGPSIRITASEL
ncbi:50S ribosomal protein L1 [Candidatus Saccharibacteria bacterium]|nr:50S ribosomal protein L1 [Candidatus Saccharibacteria bacterium]